MDTVVLEVGESPSSVSHGPDDAGSLPGRCLPAGESTEARGGTDLRLGEGGPVPGTGEAADRSVGVFSPGGHAIDRGGDRVRTVPFGPLVHEVHGPDPLGILVGGPNPAGEDHQGRQRPPPAPPGRGGAESTVVGQIRGVSSARSKDPNQGGRRKRNALPGEPSSFLWGTRLGNPRFSTRGS